MSASLCGGCVLFWRKRVAVDGWPKGSVDGREADRALQDYREAGRGGDGCRLQGGGHEAEADGGVEVPAARVALRRGA